MNNKTIKQKAIRHGEILVLPIDELPSNVEQVYEGNEYVVGHSETGHHHLAIGTKNALTVFKPMGGDSPDIFLRVNKTSKVEHQKSFDTHETKTLHEGLYLVRPKTEYDPWAKLIRQVQD